MDRGKTISSQAPLTGANCARGEGINHLMCGVINNGPVCGTEFPLDQARHIVILSVNKNKIVGV